MKRKMTILLILLLLVSTSFADVVSAHKQALNEYHKTKDLTKVIKMMEDGGIKEAVTVKPDGVSIKKYAHILNDYAYFLAETDNRYEEAIPVLERVIFYNSSRAVAYLNLGDVYAKLDDNTKKDINYLKYSVLLSENAKLPQRVQETLDAEKEFRDKISGSNRDLVSLIRIIQKSDYEIHRNPYVADNMSLEQITELYNDIKNWDNLEIIEPEYITDNSNDEKLNSYFKKYPELKKRIIEIQTINGITYEANYFKVYSVDFDNDKRNGKEHLFYCGNAIADFDYKPYSSFDSYKLFNLKEGIKLGGEMVYRPINYQTNEKREHRNYLIKYKNNYFIFEIVRLDYSINLYKWSEAENKIVRFVYYIK